MNRKNVWDGFALELWLSTQIGFLFSSEELPP